MNEGLIDGFERRKLPGDGIEIDALVGGSGPPLLLLHGFPQTRLCWQAVAPALIDSFTVVVPDLRGYGRSDKPKGGGDFSTYSKRAMAKDQIATMAALGFDTFDVAGHDRGGRVAYRMSLDHPRVVRRLAVLDILTTSDVWRAMNADTLIKMWHWPFLAQPQFVPERAIQGNADFMSRMLGISSGGFTYPPDCLADYLASADDAETVHGWCEDYRAGATIDRALDEADRCHNKITAPLLVLWGAAGNVATLDPLEKWRLWADDVSGLALKGGHYVPEEDPQGVIDALRTFFA